MEENKIRNKEAYENKMNKIIELREKAKNKECIQRSFWLTADLDDIVCGYAKSNRISIHQSLLHFFYLGLKTEEQKRFEEGKKSLLDIASKFGVARDLERQKEIQKQLDSEKINIVNSLFNVER